MANWSNEELALARRLKAAGHTLDVSPENLQDLRLDYSEGLENCIMSFGQFEFCWALWVKLQNSGRRRIYLNDFELVLDIPTVIGEPLEDPGLEDPAYDRPGGGFSYPREDVLNHRLAQGVPSRGHLEGFLLGRSHWRKPWDLKIGQLIGGRLTLWDSLDVPYMIDVQLSNWTESRRRKGRAPVVVSRASTA